MVDDGRWVVPADPASSRRLDIGWHRPRLGQVFGWHPFELRNVAAHVDPAGVKALLLTGRIEDASERGLRIDADRGDPLPVAVVARLVTVEQPAHEPTLAPAPVDAKVLGQERADQQPGPIVHPALAPQLTHAGVDGREARPALAPRLKALLGVAGPAHGRPAPRTCPTRPIVQPLSPSSSSPGIRPAGTSTLGGANDRGAPRTGRRGAPSQLR